MSHREVIESKSLPVPESGCWLWLASVNSKGYGWTGIRGAQRLAHRASYEAFIGGIPTGLGVCHKCDTPSCVNPTHLFVGTQRDNLRDASAKGRIAGQKQTHCKYGHAFTPENTMIVRGRHRECHECRKRIAREWKRRYTAAKKTAALAAAMQPKAGE